MEISRGTATNRSNCLLQLPSFSYVLMLRTTDLAWDEAAHFTVHIFHECHIEKREARLYGGENVAVTEQRVIPAL